MPKPPRHRIGGVVVVTLLTLAGVGAPAAGQQIDDKRAEAAAIAEKLNEQAGRIVEFDIRFRAAQDELADAEAAVAHAEAELASTTRRQTEIKRQLVVQAQDAYVVGGSVSLLRYLIATSPGDEVVRRAYLRVVSGQDRQLLGELRAAREDLEDLGKRLEAARRRAAAKAEAIADDRAALDRAVRAQRAVLQQVNGELVQLVAAEQARRDAEAARQLAANAPVRQAPAGAAEPASTAPAPVLAVLSEPVADTFACIRQLESGNNYSTPGGGAYQFLDSTWQSLGYSGTASDAPPAVQDEAAIRLQQRDGWSQWTTAPLCGRT